MKQYVFNWNPLTQIREVFVCENEKVITILEVPSVNGNNNYLEMAYQDGNFFTSNKDIETIIELEEIPKREYQHHQIKQDENGKYVIVSGKTWRDGTIKKFSREDEEFVKIISESVNESEVSYYDCISMAEEKTPTNNLLKIKKLTYKTK